MADVASILRAAWNQYGAGDLKGASVTLQKAIKHAPRDAGVLQLRASILFGEGKLVEAEYFARQAAAVGPDHAACHHTLGSILQAGNKLAEAEAAYLEALRCAPDHAEVLLCLAEVRRQRLDYTGSEDLLRRALSRSTGGVALTRAAVYLAAVLRHTGRPEESLAVLDDAAGKVPATVDLAVQRAVASNYVPMAPAQRFERHVRAGELIERAAGPKMPTIDRPRDPDRPLRIGYVSPDFREHSVSYFIEPVLRCHDRAKFHTTCYFTAPKGDGVTTLIRSHAGSWRDVSALSDAAFCDLVRADKVDILVDLAGHEPLNRAAAFASRPAPVQATYLGFANTTGLGAIDFRLVDAVTDPSGSEGLARERLTRLDPCFLCFAPRHRPALAAPPCADRGGGGAVTFGSFNTLMKLCRRTVAAWAAVLAAVPGSRLLLKALPLSDSGVCERVRSAFAGYGIAGDRVELIAYTASSEDHLALYKRVDIALDPLTYNGTTTTCEALWMGVPVVTLRGNAHAGRVGASLLSCVGLEELIARDEREYAAIAAGLAEDRARLGVFRSSLRERMERSELMNAPGFTARLESAYRVMWESASSPAGHASGR